MDLESGLIALVHVPKTAGSSINAVLAQALGEGIDHIESMPLDKTETLERLKTTKWISGHLPLDRMRKFVEPNYPGRIVYCSTIREPTAQVASHYNWLIEIGRRGPGFFNGHPEEIKEMHRVIATSNNADPHAVVSNLHRFSGMFLNCQSRYILGARFEALECELDELLSLYSAIVSEHTASAFVRSVAKTRRININRENASRYHFDRLVFDHPFVIEFLRERNFEDIKLYKHLEINPQMRV